ncbi:MAG: hypothetical protein ACE145_16030 [Terriglobia bacterium]
MTFFRTLGLALLVMAGYSVGAVLGRGTRAAFQGGVTRPRLLDLGAILFCWLGMLASLFSGLGVARTAAVWTVSGAILAFIFHRLLKSLSGGRPDRGVTGVESARHTSSAESRMPRGAWEQWKSFLGAVGGFQSRVILTGFYYVALMPFGILVGWLGDPLKIKSWERSSYWTPRPPTGENLDAARRQF